MEDNGFVHLHVHTQYSLLDGAIPPKRLVKYAKEQGMCSVAMTDHGNMFGAVEFYTQAVENGIKPIIGIEAYIAPGSRHDKQASGISDASYHLLLLAQNNKGYANLLKLSSLGYTEGFYYRPRIDKEILAELSEGIVCSSACISGEVPTCLLNGDRKRAREAAESFVKIFGPDRFFIEIQKYSGDEPDVTEGLIDLASDMGIGLIATNDVHFLKSEDYEAHDALTCISTGKLVSDTQRMNYPTDVYFKTTDEMSSLFSEVPEAISNTKLIADMCEVELDLKSTHAPVYKPEDKSKPDDFLRKLCYEGAKQRYGEVTKEVEERLERELEVIIGKGFASYFLIVWDFCNFALSNEIPVGARGSGVGTLVGYCLGLCDVDPVKYDLLFERFMDPQRNEMPDIDIDICQDGRAKVIDYVRKKYGQVAQIITFGTMKARAVIRDVCRVLDVPLREADRLAKLVPADLGMTLEKALQTEPDLQKAYDEDSQTHKVIEIGKRLEGLTRHASVHAAGVVVADKPLDEFVPLYKQGKDGDELITQFEGPMVEKVGLLKMDFLGLRTLSVIERARKWVKDIHGEDIDIENVDITDQKVFTEIFGAGRTKGVFQFESGGMQDLLMKLKPDRLEDLIAANALYRPGPMSLVGDYIDRKHGADWDVPHPIMRDVLAETFGIMVYQEQVMRICNRLGDIPLREAYKLIKAISKKKASIIAKEKERFINGCVEKGLSDKQANDIFELIERFAGYGFNKSHSTRYAFIAYQTAFLKAYWPVEYMAALLTYERVNNDKLVDYIGECKTMGIEVLPPDINESFSDFTVVYNKDKNGKDKGVIRFGLSAVKGVGEKAVEQIIIAREKVGRFKSLFHFCENVDMRTANKQVMEALIKAGAFDKLGGSRAQMMAGLENAMSFGSSIQADIAKGQGSLFAMPGFEDETEQGGDYSADSEHLPDVPAWSEMDMLAKEKEVLGFYVTSNPLSKHAETIGSYSTVNCGTLGDLVQNTEVVIGGMVAKIRTIVTKNGRNAGQKMAVFVLEDLQGDCEVVLFPKELARFGHLLDVDKVLFVRGKVDCAREKPNIIAEELIMLEEISDKIQLNVGLNMREEEVTAQRIEDIRSICRLHSGKSPVYVVVRTERGTVRAMAGKEYRVQPDVDFCNTMRDLIGARNFELRRN